MKLGEYVSTLIVDRRQYTIDVVMGQDPKKDPIISFDLKWEPPFVPNFYRLASKELLDQEMLRFIVKDNRITVNIKPIKFAITVPNV